MFEASTIMAHRHQCETIRAALAALAGIQTSKKILIQTSSLGGEGAIQGVDGEFQLRNMAKYGGLACIAIRIWETICLQCL